MKAQQKFISLFSRMLVFCGFLSFSLSLQAQSFSEPNSYKGASVMAPEAGSLSGYDPVTLLWLGAGFIWFVLMASVSFLVRDEMKHTGNS